MPSDDAVRHIGDPTQLRRPRPMRDAFHDDMGWIAGRDNA